MKLRIASPTPILNTPNFSFAFGGRDGNSIEKKHFEFIALRGMELEVLEFCSPFIARVSHPTYPEPNLFLDIRFTERAKSQRPPPLPPPDVILKRMVDMLGKPYVWGGNWSQGIPELLGLYPPKGEIDAKMKTLWTLAGVDCSGLLYEATDGATPRNTAQLVQYGRALDPDEALQPLDMILYPGHVLFVLDRKTIIESKSPFGVILRDLSERMDEVAKEPSFQIRRIPLHPAPLPDM